MGGRAKHRQHKEKKFNADLKILVDLMHGEKIHIKCEPEESESRSVWEAKAKGVSSETCSAVVDVLAKGMAAWNGGKMDEYIRESAFKGSAVHPLSLFSSSSDTSTESTNGQTAVPIQ